MSAGPSTMLPRNLLPGALGSAVADENSHDADVLTSLYAARLAAAAGGPRLTAGMSPASNAILLNSVLAEEQRRQTLLASQIQGLALRGGHSDRLRALLLERSVEQPRARPGLLPGLAAQADGLTGLTLAGLGVASPLINQTFNAGTTSQQHHSALLGVQSQGTAPQEERAGRKGRTGTFPQKMHQMLSDLEKEEGGTEIACFLPHGRAFAIHKPKEFVKTIMPKYFRMSRFSSFQRQLNLYDFQRITEGPDKGAYYHELFVKGRPTLSTQIKRNKIKGANGPGGIAAGAVGMPMSVPQLGLRPGLGVPALGLPAALALTAQQASTPLAYLGSLGGSGGSGRSPA